MINTHYVPGYAFLLYRKYFLYTCLYKLVILGMMVQEISFLEMQIVFIHGPWHGYFFLNPEWLQCFLQSVLSLLLRLGQCAASNPSFAQEYDNMQYSFAEFYCICMGESKNRSLESSIFKCAYVWESEHCEFLIGNVFYVAGNISYGPFVRLDTDAQELSVCCLYYLSAVDSHLMKSLAWSCLCE